MLLAGIPFEKAWRQIHKNTPGTEALVRFIKFLERRLGASFLFDEARVPFGRTEMVDLFELAEKLRQAGVINTLNPISPPSDEPPFFQWRVECATYDKHNAGGMALSSERDALIPALAEAVERFIWMSQNDYFDSPINATAAEIKERHYAILPESFAGYTKEQRTKYPDRTLRPEAKYLWIKGQSHVKGEALWVPAQIISGYYGVHATNHKHEPLILQPITTGLATGPTREFALLNGALEILERDAFMITWLNQLTPPRINIKELAQNDVALFKLLEHCERYRLLVSAVIMPTDAPTHAVCAVIRDDSGAGPNVTMGLKAHRSLVDAVKGAAMEALRIRQTIRYRDANEPLDANKTGKDIFHLERAQYWGRPGSADKLSFLTEGPMAEIESAIWENDSIEEHWRRIVSWCRDNDYECASVDVGRSKFNASPWKINFVVIPQMQPMHQTEALIYLGGDRLRSVPEKFGYKPRSEPYADEPHPFA